MLTYDERMEASNYITKLQMLDHFQILKNSNGGVDLIQCFNSI